MVQLQIGNTRYFVMITGDTLDSHKIFLDRLSISSNLHEVQSIKQSNVIIAFVPVVSRAGTDIQSAMKIIPEDKPVVLVILHHTFDPDIVVPDVRSYVDMTDVFVVDCLFHEDQGLLRCLRNDDAIEAVTDHLRRRCQCNDDTIKTVKDQLSKDQPSCDVKEKQVEPISYIKEVLAAVIGAVIGAGIGAVISALAVTLCDKCNNEHCGTGAVAGIGAGIGAVIGAGIGVVTRVILITSK
ncbi:uncharacterized protein LOC113660615 isoform X1 [Tachysurus fulvidraco]|uniref:uncharacterized protein LOC113660615 isoform X1 n=1 Tax=Tachysurus fulvidraco TaxID=1234273 RepID=UPI001FEE94B1|nr:uncharacterized protein LOC113660615 isoform X1 [Tachysurus fulvidraco]